jgi:hypothetical protein
MRKEELTRDFYVGAGCLLVLLVLLCVCVVASINDSPSSTPSRLTDDEYNNVPLQDLPPEKRKEATKRAAEEIRGDRP